MAFHEPALSPLTFLVAAALVILVFYYIIRWIRRTLGHLGLTPGEIAVIIWVTLVGGLINIPLYPFGAGWIGVNVGGAIVPVVLSLYLIRRKGLPLNEVIVGIFLVTVVSYLVTRYEPGVGVIAEFPYWLLPAFTAFLVAAFAYWHESRSSAALAYVAGTLGTLLGADLLRLPEILAGPAPTEPGTILSMGGAAVFDMVFLTGILAVTMETGLLVKKRQDLATSGAHNPIDVEYEHWVARKRAEAEEGRRRYVDYQRTRAATEARRQEKTPGAWTRAPPGASGPGEAKGEQEPRRGPPRQPRPASGTTRVPASHRARGLYK